jgi:hypothetical protein
VEGTPSDYAGGGGGRSPVTGFTTPPFTAGGANTGFGGGGNTNPGGSGIVVIRYLGAQKGTGGTVRSAFGYTSHTFTSSGTYTA